MSESEIQHEIRIATGRLPDVRLFRNNVGVADVRGAKVRFGLCKGSSDLIGFLRMEINGVKFARFLALEVKTSTGKTTPEQELFMTAVRAFGGFACVVRSVADALAALERARKGEYE